MEKNLHTEFHVLLNGIKLSEEAESRIDKGIRALVATEIAAYEPAPDQNLSSGAVYYIPKKWIGIEIDVLSKKQLDDSLKVTGIQIGASEGHSLGE